MTIWLEHGDMRTVLQRLYAEDAQVDAIVTDPPYELGFMGKKWDNTGIATQVNTWRLCWDLLPPGGHLLAFSGTRTYHRMAVAIEEAGFEIRDQICWIYGQGFPKSLDVSKAIDKMGGVEVAKFKQTLAATVKTSKLTRKQIDDLCGFTMRFDISYEADSVGWGISLPSPEKWQTIARVLKFDPGTFQELVDRVWRGRCGAEISPNGSMSGGNFERTDKGVAASDLAAEWEGWGTALKPAMEPICVARKPLDGTVAANMLKHGVGALNIDGCRVATNENLNGGAYSPGERERGGAAWDNGVGGGVMRGADADFKQPAGRWPANVVHDGSEEVVRGFPQSEGMKAGKLNRGALTGRSMGYHENAPQDAGIVGYSDNGSASRFFYCAKANAKERMGFDHPTVKPIALLRWLVRMVTPPGGVVLDPFAGTGTMGAAAEAEGFDAILVEREAKYAGFIKERLPAAQVTVHDVQP